MKRTLVSLLILFFVITMDSYSQDLSPITLQKPNLTAGSSLMTALQNRRSVREYAATELSVAELSDLLWAAYGISSADGKRTAPTAQNAQEIDVYVITKAGAYHYVSAPLSAVDGGQLVPIHKGDLRQAVAGGQDFSATAPVSIVITGDVAKFRSGDNPRSRRLIDMDGGIVSQNIAIFCASRGLCTVPRATMDEKVLRTALKLKDSQHLILNHPVGHKK